MIEANFEGQEMTLQYSEVISDSVRFLKIHFNFDDYWEDMDKTATFDYNGEKYIVALADGSGLYLGNNTCYVPQEVIKSPCFTVSVFGTKSSTRITSSEEPVSVVESEIGNRIPRDPTPAAWSQMLSIANNAKDIAESVEERADEGEFDGVGIPDGGTVGQVLVKNSQSDYDTKWSSLKDSYTKTESDQKYVPKTTKINGKSLSGDILINHLDVGAYAKPQGGIPQSDLEDAVKTKLNKADTALQQHQDLSSYAQKTWVESKNYLTRHQSISGKQDKIDSLLSTTDKSVVGAINELNTTKGDYSLPNGGIPKNDLSSNVKASLLKADTAIQSHQDISMKADKTDTYTKSQVDALIPDISGKADKNDVNAEFEKKQNKFAERSFDNDYQYLSLTKPVLIRGRFGVATPIWVDDATPKSYVDNHHDNTKQDKLTAGTNITIDANNVISASGGGGLTDYTLIAEAQPTTEPARKVQAVLPSGADILGRYKDFIILAIIPAHSSDTLNIRPTFNFLRGVTHGDYDYKKIIEVNTIQIDKNFSNALSLQIKVFDEDLLSSVLLTNTNWGRNGTAISYTSSGHMQSAGLRQALDRIEMEVGWPTEPDLPIGTYMKVYAR